MPDHIYLSPHLDDAVLSCGGVIYQQTSQGESVQIVTIFAGDPPKDELSSFARSLHQRWGIDGPSVEIRRQEDLRACEIVGAEAIHLPIPEAIYRKSSEDQSYYASEASIFGVPHPSEDELQQRIAGMLAEICPSNVPIYVPAGYGGHVDHLLLRGAVTKWAVPTIYYQDFPYAMRAGELSSDFPLPLVEKHRIQLTSHAIKIWSLAVKEYRSQLTTFWSDEGEVESELLATHEVMEGIPFLTPV